MGGLPHRNDQAVIELGQGAPERCDVDVLVRPDADQRLGARVHEQVLGRELAQLPAARQLGQANERRCGHPVEFAPRVSRRPTKKSGAPESRHVPVCLESACQDSVCHCADSLALSLRLTHHARMLSQRELTRLALDSEVDTRTALRWLCGMSVRPELGERLGRVARELGLDHAAIRPRAEAAPERIT